MQLKLGNKGVLEIQGESGTVGIMFDPKAKADGYDVVVGNLVSAKVNFPGEYEYGGFAVAAVEIKSEKDGTLDVVRTRVDGVNVMAILRPVTEITNEAWDAIGDVDILAIDGGMQIPDLGKLINKVAPYVVIVTNSSKEAVEKATGMTVESVEKKFKFTDKDFELEDVATRLMVLE